MLLVLYKGWVKTNTEWYMFMYMYPCCGNYEYRAEKEVIPMNDINNDGVISTSTKTIYDGTLLLNGEEIQYDKLTLKSEVRELISYVEQLITVVTTCDYNQGPQEIIPEPVTLSLNAPDNIIIQDLHHTGVSTTPDGASLFTLKGKYYGGNVRWGLHSILEDWE